MFVVVGIITISVKSSATVQSLAGTFVIYRVATMYGLYGMSGPYIVLMYGSNPYIFGLNVRIFGLGIRIKDI